MANDNASIPDLISTALRQASRLIRDEVQLAKAEMSANVTDAVRPVGFLIGGACVVIAALVSCWQHWLLSSCSRAGLIRRASCWPPFAALASAVSCSGSVFPGSVRTR
jgi:hypothetical protein